ncbi:kinase-like domain-containing protein [Umbelopsis sp. PMI_123]|nr:kinase-like domain-containing protein [Umbelopsis sp. PMI_123]
MQHVNGIPVYNSDPNRLYEGLKNCKPTWYSAQGGVYRCRQQMSPNKLIAIKKYYVAETQEDPNAFIMPRDLVENEIYAMTRCAPHQNILELLSVHLHQECIYLVMPLCTGGSLQEYVFENRITVGQLVYILQALVSGLHEIHRHGYIHRDIKCDNIFLTRETNEIVIGDFGVVSIQPTADSAAEEAGVVLFWAPEAVEGKVVDNKIDIWALGIVIMEILNGGKAPYEDEDGSEDRIKEIILEVGRPQYPPSLPPMLVNFMNRCLEVDPYLRATADKLLKHPFLTQSEAEYLFPSYPLHDYHTEHSEHVEEQVEITLDAEDRMEAIHSTVDMSQEREAMYTSTIIEDTYPTESEEAEMRRIEDRLETLQQLTQAEGKLANHVNVQVVTEHDDIATQSNLPVEVMAIDQQLETDQPATSPSQDINPPSSRPARKSMQFQRSYLPRLSILLATANKGATETSKRTDELSKLHPVQQAYDVFHRRTNMYTSYRRQGSRLPLFTAAIGPKEKLPSTKPAEAKPLKRVKSMMVTPVKEERAPVKVRRAFSVANFKDKENIPSNRTSSQTTARTQKRVSQPATRNSTIIESTRTSRKKAADMQNQPLEKPMRKPQTKIESKVAKPPSSADRTVNIEARKTQPKRNETMNKLLKQEANLRFSDRRAGIKA